MNEKKEIPAYKKYGGADAIRLIIASIVAFVLFISIIGIPVAIVIMQLERIIQLLAKTGGDEK